MTQDPDGQPRPNRVESLLIELCNSGLDEETTGRKFLEIMVAWVAFNQGWTTADQMEKVQTKLLTPTTRAKALAMLCNVIVPPKNAKGAAFKEAVSEAVDGNFATAGAIFLTWMSDGHSMMAAKVDAPLAQAFRKQYALSKGGGAEGGKANKYISDHPRWREHAAELENDESGSRRSLENLAGLIAARMVLERIDRPEYKDGRAKASILALLKMDRKTDNG